MNVEAWGTGQLGDASRSRYYPQHTYCVCVCACDFCCEVPHAPSVAHVVRRLRGGCGYQLRRGPRRAGQQRHECGERDRRGDRAHRGCVRHSLHRLPFVRRWWILNPCVRITCVLVLVLLPSPSPEMIERMRCGVMPSVFYILVGNNKSSQQRSERVLLIFWGGSRIAAPSPRSKMTNFCTVTWRLLQYPRWRPRAIR